MRGKALAALLVILSGGCHQKQAGSSLIVGQTMGTTWSIRFAEALDDASAQRFQRAVQQRLDAWENALSRWRDDSALARFNASRSTGWQDADPLLVQAVALAHDIAAKTDGALDITIAPLVTLWGFDKSGPPPQLPDSARIEALRQQCGWQKIAHRRDPPQLRKASATLTINVDAVAEGLAADDIAALLEHEGQRHFLINLGGEIVARGSPEGGGPWLVGIQSPGSAEADPLTNVPLHQQALATSGSYRQNYQRDGRTFSHLIDPRTGRPIGHTLQSVTVIAPTCAEADAWATALMVLGREKGEPLAQKFGLQAVWIEPSP